MYHKTKVPTRFGLLEFVRVPVEFSDAAQTFRNVTHKIRLGFEYVRVYLSDISAAGHSARQQLRHLRIPLCCIRKGSTPFNVLKRELGKPSGKFWSKFSVPAV